MVSIRTPSRNQRCIAFNATLSKEACLAKYTHVAIKHDEAARKLIFIPTNDEEQGGEPTHRLQGDGGHNTVSKAIYLHAEALKAGLVPTKRYPATFVSNSERFWIQY
jgi:hypothetical protein